MLSRRLAANVNPCTTVRRFPDRFGDPEGVLFFFMTCFVGQVGFPGSVRASDALSSWLSEKKNSAVSLSGKLTVLGSL